MKFLFGPGIALMHRLHNTQKLPLLSLAFTVPLAIVVYQTYDELGASSIAWIAATWVLALYCMASFYLQADAGWTYFISMIKKVADGDLTATLNAKMGG